MKNDVPFWLAALVTAVVLAIVPLPPWMVDQFYSREFYPVVQGIMTTISNAVPLAVLDLLIVALVLLVIRWLIRFVRLTRKESIAVAVSDLLRRFLRTASILSILFLVMWGLNYRRIPLEESLNLTGAAPSADDLQAVILEANSVAGRMRPGLALAADGGYEEVVRKLPVPFNAALRQLNRLPLGVPGRPKYSLILTPYFTAAGIDGMIDPLVLESIVHPDLLPIERPFVLAHEWAHLAGAADEAEASAIGWLACMKGEPALAYSASLYLIGEAAGSLPPDRWHALVPRLDPAVRGDLDAIAQRVERERPAVQHTASAVYDTYLRANRVGDGVASYSRAVTLILSPPFHDALVQFRTSHGP